MKILTMKKMILPTFFFLLSFSHEVNAQDTLNIFPGSQEIEVDKITAHVSRLKFYTIQNGEKKERGIYTDSIAFITMNGKKILARYAFFPARKLSDTAWYDATTLLPLFNKEISIGGDSWNIQYSSNRVKGYSYSKKNDSTANIDQLMEQAYFDGYINDFLPRFLKLRQGYHARIPLYAFGQKGVTWLNVSVIGSSPIELAGQQTADAWEVVISWPNFPDLTYLYIEKNTRAILKIKIKGTGYEILKELI